MTVEEAVVQALARVSEFGDGVPATRSLCYHRIGVRQQQIFAAVAAIDPDYFGVCASAALTDGMANLEDMVDSVPAADSITRIEIADPGTSSYAPGTRIRLVRLDEEHTAAPPRVRIRNHVIEQIGTDLAGVEKIMVYYPRRPQPIGPADGEKDLELPDPFQDLLVVDLAKYLIAKAVSMEAERRIEALRALSAEEEQLLAGLEAHVRGFQAAAQSAP